MIDSNRIAVTHDWLLEYAGAERVLEQILKVAGKNTDIYTNVFDGTDLPFLSDHEVTESFISRLPFGRTHYRKYLPLMPYAVEQWDMSPYDIVISSNYAVAKGFISHPDQLHISYVHSPVRYAWDMQHQYLEEAGLRTGIKSILARWILHKIRIWDVRTANGVDYFIANSEFIKRRITKVYRRESVVIYPPVDIVQFKLQKGKDDYYVTSGRMVPYKKHSLLIDAFNQMPDKKLIIAGDGPDFKKLKSKAKSNIEFAGFVKQSTLVRLIQNAKAFVYAAKEDFGIAPVEAQACGTPVIALGRGGTAETVKPLSHQKPTGVLFKKQNKEHIIDAVKKLEKNYEKFTPEIIRENAKQFAEERFRNEMQTFIEEKWSNFNPY